MNKLKIILIGVAMFVLVYFFNLTVFSKYPFLIPKIWWLSLPWPYLFLYLVVLAPVIEEVIHRRLIMEYFLKKKKTKVAYFVSSITFGLHHILSGWGLLKFFTIFASGFVYGYIYEKDKLKGSLLLHVTNNLCSFAVLAMTNGLL